MAGKGVQINRTEPDSKKANISEMLKIPKLHKYMVNNIH